MILASLRQLTILGMSSRYDAMPHYWKGLLWRSDSWKGCQYRAAELVAEASKAHFKGQLNPSIYLSPSLLNVN